MRFKFPMFKVKELEEEIKLKESALNDGKENLPKTSSENKSDCENEAVIKCGELRSKSIAAAVDFVETFKKKIINHEAELGKKHFFIESIKNRLENTLNTAKGSLSNLKDQFDIQDKEVKNFRLENNINRDPQSLTFTKIIMGIGLVVALFIVELGVNTALLAPAMPTGETAARSISAAVAALNVFISFLAGYFILKNFNIKSLGIKRTLSQIGLFSYSLFIIYLNWMLGAFRAQAEQKGKAIKFGEDQPMVAETTEGLGNVLFPWTVDFSFYAVVLTFVGISFAIFSLLDGYFFDDPYPGYGRVGKNRNENKKEINRIRQHITTEITAIIKNGIRDVEEKRDRLISKVITEWSNNIMTLDNVFEGYRRYVRELESGIDHIMEEYIIKNEPYRTTEAPKYWKKPDGTRKKSGEFFKYSEETKDPLKAFSDYAPLYLNKKQIEEQLKKYQDKITEEANDFLHKLNVLKDQILKEIDLIRSKYDPTTK